MSYYIRWMIRRDLPQCLEIEEAGSACPMNNDEILAHLQNRNCIGMVVEQGETILGFMMYELHRDCLRLAHAAVNPNVRLLGVGRSMMDNLREKLSPHRRNRIVLDLPESELLTAGKFFLRCGFRGVGIRPNLEGTGHDICMEYNLKACLAKTSTARNLHQKRKAA